jgi:hypothetical protein
VRPELRRIGAGRHPLVIVDGFSGDVAGIVETAAALAPFPRAGNYYPGLRRVITREDAAADAYVVAAMERAAPFIGGGFDIDAFDLVEASFSMVTDPPHALAPAQRAPHFDSTDPGYVALLHYLGGTGRTGTAFYRHRGTGIEAVDDANVDRFVTAARRESAALSGYIAGDNACFEQIHAVEGVPDRLIVYQGCLLHSGAIPPDLPLDTDPRRGRLTANFFIQGRRA